MDILAANRSRTHATRFITVLLAVSALALFGCSDQTTDPGASPEANAVIETINPVPAVPAEDPITETMQISPFKINLQSKGASESVLAIIGLYIPGDYHLADFDFTLSFNDEAVLTAFDCYYCYIDNNLIISFDKNDVIASPVTVQYANMEVVATVDGHFRVENGIDGYDTQLSRVAMVEIVSPSQRIVDPEVTGTDLGR